MSKKVRYIREYRERYTALLLVYICFRSDLLHGIAFKKKRFNNFLKEISYFLFILILFINY